MAATEVGLAHALSTWKAREPEAASGLAAPLLEAAAAALTRPDPTVPDASWHAYLDATADPAFLLALPDAAARERWADTAVRAIRESGYSLATLLAQRAAAHPDRIFLQDPRERDTPSWSYGEVARYARAIAGVFLAARPEPRVAIFCENGVDGAVTDLACLTTGILVTPLNVHLDDETLAWIFHRLDINIVVTDTDEREARAREAAKGAGQRVVVYRTGSGGGEARGGGSAPRRLRRECAELDLDAAAGRLAGRQPDIMAPATVMFTSGSTGRAKGVVFSQSMLVTKRFARAAALPSVGRNEVLLCYLPLFHTFGRYLELLGTLYWRGTYVFAGNPSAEALMAQLAVVRPTGLISVPVRWTQIREHCLELMEAAGDARSDERVVREVVGNRLRWGLSAAGYLDPRVFRFFQRHGVDLCSGFGMTEATGGITMTPPGGYVDGTVGPSLPAIETRLSDQGELSIAGPYVAAYLDEDGPPGSLPALDPDAERWLPTGDLFRRHDDGYYEIVDRIKDIYKNSRGQTVAPQRVERRFVDVPGIRRTFLAGDGRDHNVLLVVPDPDDPVVADQDEESRNEYLARVVASANAGLAPYERVVRFAVLDRDFAAERGELTPKGSYRRKAIEASFAPVLESLYRSSHVELEAGGVAVRIPRWFFRDLGILDDDVVARDGALENRRTGRRLLLHRTEAGRVRVGDLEYELRTEPLDLGLFARQPRLWLGNPSLAAFSPCKTGWDVALRGVAATVRLPRPARRRPARPAFDAPEGLNDDALRDLHQLAATALFGVQGDALSAIDRLGNELARGDARAGSTLRRRLEALAFHRDPRVRARAYRTLLLDAPLIDHENVFPSFIESGLPFLDEESIAAIATARRGERRLQALRQRLHTYRTELPWPGPPTRRRQFRRIFRMLADYARNHRHDFVAVQAELAAWALFDGDPVLARAAQRHLDELTAWHEERLGAGAPDGPARAPAPGETAGKVVFEYGIPLEERTRLEAVLGDPTFLRASIARAFGDEGFAWAAVGSDGVWVSHLPSHHRLRIYRLGINLLDGRHYDLLLVSGETLRRRAVQDTVLWLAALSDQPFGAPVLPRFGAWRRDLGAVTVAYLSELTAWERIRELSGRYDDIADPAPAGSALRKLYVRALAAFFRAWEQSGFRIVPGAVTPSNVALPDADFHERTSILSLAGWRPYGGPASLVRPMVRSFYRLASAHYPQTRPALRLSWIFDACIEALGPSTGRLFLEALDEALEQDEQDADCVALRAALRDHRAALDRHEYVPLAVVCAVDRFHEWARRNPAASRAAREDATIQMVQLYRLERFATAHRYRVYRDTYFADADEGVAEAFDRLVDRCLQEPRTLPAHLEELSTLQARIRDPFDRAVFSRMIFPRARRSQQLEVLALGEADEQRVVIRSAIRDRGGAEYAVREPVSAAEVGQLYHLILEAGYPIRVAGEDRQLVVLDREERIVGGLSYRLEPVSPDREGEEDGAAVATVDGIVIAAPLVHRGLGGRLLEDFCVRMAGQDARVVRTNFFLGGLFSKHGFRVDRRWGGLVRVL